ncbi:histidine kinase dimerization/phosphoacceptor domain -containing protein [Siccirubricoccus sp. G192]|uniref:sensor histidine kinase n=1 Tax=Siccirubricoccus sp. G192 TaxID=2849651 RepID=UPI0028112DE6|nr:histidine kinase dimerization/phosphoacceptor domain -containing protein [Siccirubricoccus sp. G192]
MSEIRVRLRQQELIGELGRFALAEHDFDELLAEAARLAAEGLDTPLAKVMQYRPGEDTLLVRAGIGWRPGVVGVARLGTDLASPAGYALKTGAPVISNHLAGETRFRTPALMVEHGVRRAVNVVVRGQREPFGVLEADSRDPGDFSPRDVVFLEGLANVLGLAVDREADRAARDAALRDKDLLMVEIHHRVRNSLFLVQSLLSLQARAATDAAVRTQLDEAVKRVATVAAVHRRLYSGDTLGEIDAADYLGALLRDLGEQAPGRTVRLEAAANILWSADRATACGLVVTELVINALKYGAGTITVQVEAEPDGAVRMAVEDEGGRPAAGLRPGRHHRPRHAHPARPAARRQHRVRPRGAAHPFRRDPAGLGPGARLPWRRARCSLAPASPECP